MSVVARWAAFSLVAGVVTVASPAQVVSAQTPAALTLTDLRGRTVTVKAPAKRLLIDDGRYLIALSLIHQDPVSLVAGWPKDVNRIGERTHEQYRAKFPKLDAVPQVASSAGSFSLEKAFAVQPDVAVFTLGLGPTDEQIRQMEAAGIAVVFIDFFSHPLENLAPSLELLGKITGRSAQAKAFLDFRKTHLDHIAKKLSANRVASPPKVFVEAHAGMSEECCNSPGKGNVGDYIAFVGGHNIGADVLPGTYGRVNLEFIIAQDPFVYIATGGPHLEKAGGLVLGAGYTPERARAALAKVSARTGIATLSAVRAGRVHGIAHQLLNSPLDIVAVEALARWTHPSLFADVNPATTLAEINKRFLAVPIDGPQWIDLR